MISDQITLLNETVLEVLNEADEVKIVKAFMDVGLKVLKADFGFVWLNSTSSDELMLAYKSPKVPFEPNPPREGGRNYNAIKSGRPNFVTHTESTPDAKYVSQYVKSFVVIPLVYKKAFYGTMVLCFKNQELFSKEKKTISVFIGNSVAQAITISRLVASEQESRLQSERQQAYFKALIENSYEVIVLVTELGEVIYVSPSVRKVFGYKSVELIGKKVENFIYPNNTQKVKGYLSKILQSPNRTHQVEFHFVHPNGNVSTMESTGLNMLNNPHVKGIVLNVRDITEQKKAEILREAQLLFKEEKLKNEFIANATHEFRTPLAIIKGNAELALRNKSETVSSLRAVLRSINTEVNLLAALVSDMGLLTNKMRTLQNTANHERVNLTLLIEDICKRVQILALDKNIKVKVKKSKAIFVKGDEEYLEKLFINLMKNSIIYGKKNGETSISIDKVGDQVKICIKDNGIGISKEDLPYIFERFFRADKARTGTESGTGLGLAIVKWVVAAHKGTVDVTSKVGQGTSFYVTLPALK